MLSLPTGKDPGWNFSCVKWEWFSPEIESVVPDVLHQDEAFWTLLLSVPQASALVLTQTPLLCLLGVTC